MDSEIVLFLREAVNEAVLQQALEELFGLGRDLADEPLVVRYPQGFALGVSVPGACARSSHHAAALLAERLDSPVLLESLEGGKEAWLLFLPGVAAPVETRVVELRHGLDVVTPLPQARRAPAAC